MLIWVILVSVAGSKKLELIWVIWEIQTKSVTEGTGEKMREENWVRTGFVFGLSGRGEW